MFDVSLMIITKKKPILYPQKIKKKELKHTTTKRSHHKESKKGRIIKQSEN